MKRVTKQAVTAAAVLGVGAIAYMNTGAGPLHSPSAALAARAPSGPVAALTGDWSIDPAHTNVNFAVKHFGVSTVRGRFDEVAGTIKADTAHPENSAVEVTIQTASIDTNVKMRDDHLRSPDFFDAKTYPTITFRSTSIKRSGRGFVANGALTIHGVSKEVALPFTVVGPVKDTFGGTRFGAETHLRVNRQDYGVKWQQTMDNGGLAVADDVDIDISLEAIPAKPAEKK